LDVLTSLVNLSDDHVIAFCVKLILLAGVCEVVVPHLLHVTKLLWGGFTSGVDAVFDFLEHVRDRWYSLRNDTVRSQPNDRNAA
jgi:hypothetical protein